MPTRRSSAWAVALALLVAPETARAFCRTSSCPNKGTAAVCTPAQPNDCGTPLFWSDPCIGFSLQKDGSKVASLADAEQIFRDAFTQWEHADCGGGSHPHIAPVDMGPVECNKHEYNQQAGNANIILFRDDGWPYSGGDNTLALTTVTYNLDTGEIYDADIEINSASGDITIGDTNVGYDLASIAQHETGHFLGLAHSDVSDATMYSMYKKGDLSLRTIEADDRAAICAAYAPGAAIADNCTPNIRHGFSSQCASAQSSSQKGCCAVAPGAVDGDPESLHAALAFGAAAALALGRRRRARAS